MNKVCFFQQKQCECMPSDLSARHTTHPGYVTMEADTSTDTPVGRAHTQTAKQNNTLFDNTFNTSQYNNRIEYTFLPQQSII